MKLSWRVMILAAAVLAILVALPFFIPRMISPDSRGVALNDLPQMYAPESKALGHVVIETYREYRANAAR
jgi:hypothetical protein